jgi:hypothetical protein
MKKAIRARGFRLVAFKTATAHAVEFHSRLPRQKPVAQMYFGSFPCPKVITVSMAKG